MTAVRCCAFFDGEAPLLACWSMKYTYTAGDGLLREGTWVSVRDLAGSGHPSPADAIRLIDAGLLVGERRADGQVWVNERALLEAAAAHGQRLRERGKLSLGWSTT